MISFEFWGIALTAFEYFGCHGSLEMKNCKEKGLCCGAGGAQMFKEPEKGNQDININRTTEAIKTKASKIATSCSFCNTMLSDGVKNLAEGTMDVMDICELIVLSKNLN